MDLICRRRRPFSETEFARRMQVEVAGMKLYVASAEDVLLAKLEWAHRGGSARQIEDAAGILRVRRDELDHDYLARWVAALGISAEWAAARSAASAT